MNKKGMIFLLTISLLSVILLGIFLTYQTFEYQDKQRVVSTKIFAMDSFISDLESDLERVIHIGSHRSFIAMEDYVAARSSFLDDVRLTFKETLSQGTIEGSSAILMNDSSLDAYFTTVNTLMNRQGLMVDYVVDEVFLYHIDPWIIKVDVVLNITVSDREETATWRFSKMYSSSVDITGFRDPLYSVNTENRVQNTLDKSEGSLVTNNDTSNLEEHIQNSYYIASNKSPSFLDRFENNVEPNPYGIESVVNINILSDQNINVYPDRIKVDYMYFNNLDGNKICDVDGIPDNLYFILTQNRIPDYDLEGVSHSTSC